VNRFAPPGLRSNPPSTSNAPSRGFSTTATRRAWSVSNRRAVKRNASSAGSAEEATTATESSSSLMFR
jgi:hypothetical protein